MKNTLRKLAAGAIIVGALILGTAGVASAHTATPAGVATCQADGIYSVAYNIVLTNVPSGDTGTISLVSTVPATGLSVTGLPQTHVGNGTLTGITVDGIAGDLHSTSLTIHATWPDYTDNPNPTVTVPLSGDCEGPPVTTTTLIPPVTTTTLPPTTTTTSPPVTTTTLPPTTTTTVPVTTTPPTITVPGGGTPPPSSGCYTGCNPPCTGSVDGGQGTYYGNCPVPTTPPSACGTGTSTCIPPGFLQKSFAPFATVTPAAPASSSGLPFTGAPVGAELLIGSVLVLSGIGLVLVVRKRRGRVS